MQCRSHCGACCIAPSISSVLPGSPGGKKAEVSCVNLRPDYSCAAYEKRPAVCRDFDASPEYCGSTREEALVILAQMELLTKP